MDDVLQELTIFVYYRYEILITPDHSEYNFFKFFDLSVTHTTDGDLTLDYNNIELPPVYTKLSLATGIWIQSSVIAVLTICCAL